MLISIDRYIGSKQKEFDEVLLSKDDVLITAPTDSGKTHSVIDFAQRHPRLQIAFIMPTQNLVRNIKENYRLTAGYGAEFIRDNSDVRFVCTTYDSFLKFNRPSDLVIIDEAHTIAGHGLFRTDVLAGLLRSKGKKIFLTGTPEIIEKLDGVQKVEFIRSQPYKYARIIQSNRSSKNTIINIISERNDKNLLLIRINNKNLIDEVFDAFKNSISIIKIYSDSDEVLCAGQDERIVSKVKAGNIPQEVQVLLTTSIIDAGVSLKVERDVDCYAIGENYMPNPIDVVQLSARVRTNSTYAMKMNIVGKFGNYEHGDIGVMKRPTEEQLVKLMANYYQEYAMYSQESYLSILHSYNIRADIYQEGKDKSSVYVGKLNSGQVVRNLHNFTLQFCELKERYRATEQEDWTEYFKGDSEILSEPNSQVYRLFEKVTLATDYKIHPSLYLNESFQESKLDSLINAVESFNKSKKFQRIVLQMLENMHSDFYKMELCSYADLSVQDQKSVKAFARLIFEESKNWTRKSHTLKPIAFTCEVDMFLNNFSWKLRLVA